MDVCTLPSSKTKQRTKESSLLHWDERMHPAMQSGAHVGFGVSVDVPEGEDGLGWMLCWALPVCAVLDAEVVVILLEHE